MHKNTRIYETFIRIHKYSIECMKYSRVYEDAYLNIENHSFEYLEISIECLETSIWTREDVHLNSWIAVDSCVGSLKLVVDSCFLSTKLLVNSESETFIWTQSPLGCSCDATTPCGHYSTYALLPELGILRKPRPLWLRLLFESKNKVSGRSIGRMLPKSGMPMLELSLRICFNAENSKPEISWMLHAVARVLTVSLTIIWVSSGKQVAWLICQTTSASCAGVPVNTCSCSSNARRWNAPLTTRAEEW